VGLPALDKASLKQATEPRTFDDGTACQRVFGRVGVAARDRAAQGLIWIEGSTFRMGSDRHYPEEAPAHRVRIDGFWIDRTPVTNRQFREFVKATGYVTFAEVRPDPKDYPGALPHMLRAGSLVFTPPKHAVDLSDWS
jgi:sulfatase modifying factor 1